MIVKENVFVEFSSMFDFFFFLLSISLFFSYTFDYVVNVSSFLANIQPNDHLFYQ